MMDITWYILGVLTSFSAYFIWEISKKYTLDWISWAGLASGTVLILFCIAWAVGAVLEGVPRAASMGLLLFGMSGIVILTITAKLISAKNPPAVPEAKGE